MSRLTCKYDVDNVLRDMCTFDRESNVEADDCLTCFEYCNNKDMNCEHCAIQKAFDKLAEYEDLEEQGLLLKLPYPLGTKKVYVVDDYEIYELNATEITFCKADILAKIPYKTVICVDYCEFYYEDFGKTVFLTKEEAEKALEEMGYAE